MVDVVVGRELVVGAALVLPESEVKVAFLVRTGQIVLEPASGSLRALVAAERIASEVVFFALDPDAGEKFVARAVVTLAVAVAMVAAAQVLVVAALVVVVMAAVKTVQVVAAVDLAVGYSEEFVANSTANFVGAGTDVGGHLFVNVAANAAADDAALVADVAERVVVADVAEGTVANAAGVVAIVGCVAAAPFAAR